MPAKGEPPGRPRRGVVERKRGDVEALRAASIYMPESLHREIRLLAADRDITVSEACVQLLQAGLERMRAK